MRPTVGTKSDGSWRTDLGTSDHMTSLSSLFSTYNLCLGREKVRIVDGSLSFVSGKGSIPVTPFMSFTSVLNVPYLAHNLLSMARITADLNCRVIFLFSLLVLQNLVIGKMIDSGSLKDGLYMLDS
jgi:hypothetical protein